MRHSLRNQTIKIEPQTTKQLYLSTVVHLKKRLQPLVNIQRARLVKFKRARTTHDQNIELLLLSLVLMNKYRDQIHLG